MIDKFTNSAKNLTRNPLGIVALFISLIYGFACLVLSTSISNLISNKERLPLIWFIIIFPFTILIAFIFLVIKHHEKLYSPSDFRADDAFIQTIDSNKIKQKALDQVQNIEEAANKNVSENNNEKIESINDDIDLNGFEENKIENYSDSSIQKHDRNYSKEELLQMVTNSEKWVIQSLSLKYNVLFNSNVKLHTQNSSFELDGFGSIGNTTYAIETKFWQSSKSINQLKLLIQKDIEKTKSLEKTYSVKNQEFFIIIAIVFDDLKAINTKEIFNFIKNLYDNTKVELYQYNDLKSDFE